MGVHLDLRPRSCAAAAAGTLEPLKLVWSSVHPYKHSTFHLPGTVRQRSLWHYQQNTDPNATTTLDEIRVITEYSASRSPIAHRLATRGAFAVSSSYLILLLPPRIESPDKTSRTTFLTMAFLILVIGDLHIPDRALDIPAKVLPPTEILHPKPARPLTYTDHPSTPSSSKSCSPPARSARPSA